MAFFFTTPKRTMIPSADMIESSCRNSRSESRANGMVRGSDSMMVTGWSHDANCAASTTITANAAPGYRKQRRRNVAGLIVIGADLNVAELLHDYRVGPGIHFAVWNAHR